LSLNSQLTVRMFEELAVSPTITTQLLAHSEYGVRSKRLISSGKIKSDFN